MAFTKEVLSRPHKPTFLVISDFLSSKHLPSGIDIKDLESQFVPRFWLIFDLIKEQLHY